MIGLAGGGLAFNLSTFWAGISIQHEEPEDVGAMSFGRGGLIGIWQIAIGEYKRQDRI